MYEYFHVSVESFFFLPLIWASHLVIQNTKEISDRVMLPWVKCALTRDCICPIGNFQLKTWAKYWKIVYILVIILGAQSTGCRFNKRPQYRYSGCHEYDTSALNIVLGMHFDFDETQYIHQERETYFNKLQPEVIAEEYAMIVKQNNVTELNAKNHISTER